MRKVVLLLVAVLIVGLAGGLGFTIYSSKQKEKEYAEELAAQQFLIDDLQWQVSELGQTETVYGLAYDVKSGTVVHETDLAAFEVPAVMAEAYAKDMNELIGMYYLLDYSKDTLLTNEMVYEVELKSDNRILDVICDKQPVGFNAGDIVDVRITFPDGQDYLLLHKKLVKDVYGNAMRLLVDEKDIIIYKSAESDWSRFIKNGVAGTSVQIYCTLYVEAGIQSADRYYPIQSTLPDGETVEGSILWVAAQDKNLIKSDVDLADWLTIDRKTFEVSMIQFDVYRRLEIDYETGEKSYVVDLEAGGASVNGARQIRDRQYADAVNVFENREAQKLLDELNASMEQ